MIDVLNKLNPEESQKILIKVFSQYLNPSFGALSKREIDLTMFSCLIEADVFGATPTPYTIMRELKITRAKASNLLYEYNLRKASDETLKEDLAKILNSPILDKVKSSRKIGLEVENPLLKDYVRNILKQQGQITDSTFNNDILYMSFEAYERLFYDYSGHNKEEVYSKLVEQGVATRASDIGESILDFLMTKFVGDKSKDIVDTISKLLKDKKTK